MKTELFIYLFIILTDLRHDVTGMMSVEIVETSEQGLKTSYVK